MGYYNKPVPFEIAIKMRNQGYDKNYGYQYDADGNLCDPAAPGGHPGVCETPTYADALDWFIEKEGMCVSVYAINLPKEGVKWISHLMDIGGNEYDGSFGYKPSFEEGIEPALKKALELIANRS